MSLRGNVIPPNNSLRSWRDFVRECFCFGSEAVNASNLVPRAHVPFGQHQDTELWNNQFPETKILGLPASRRMRALV